MWENKHYIDYLPEFYHKVRDFQELNATVNPTMDNTMADIEIIKNDMAVKTCSEQKIAYWEDECGIKSETSDVEERRQNILTYLQGAAKLTEERIKYMVYTYTSAENTEVSFDADTSTIEIIVYPPDKGTTPISGSEMETLKRLLEPAIPAHLNVSITRRYSTWGNLKNNADDWQDVYDTYDDWQELKEYIFENK